MPRPSPPSVGAEAPRAAEPTVPADSNVAVGSHSQYVPTLTAAAAWRINAAVSKAAPWWPWPWKWCPSHVWRGLTLSILVFLGLSVLDLGPMYETDTSDRHQTASSLNAPPIRGGGIINETRNIYCHSLHSSVFGHPQFLILATPMIIAGKVWTAESKGWSLAL